MGYAEQIGSQRATCWGEPRSYDPNDIDCAQCRHRHSCRSEVDRKSTGPTNPVNHNRPYATQHRRAEAIGGAYEPGLMRQDENPVERFAKDAAGGALRGMFYEMYQFWCHFRIR